MAERLVWVALFVGACTGGTMSGTDDDAGERLDASSDSGPGEVERDAAADEGVDAGGELTDADVMLDDGGFDAAVPGDDAGTPDTGPDGQAHASAAAPSPVRRIVEDATAA